jgi:N-acetylglutamate synthase
VRARYVQRLTPDDVGSRVTVRRWVEDEERGARPADVLGHLLAWSDEGVLTVRTRDGDDVEVYVGDILASRVIPEAPPRAGRPRVHDA